ncbi:MAG: NifB/NifX family molybdenum-iron cluster-binding protein [Desulfobacteraceae bacterium]|uniref:NifB/NifX family molybdenum-iron cluster-binding protein n=1 Tax=Candidatus Desulfaltia bathyphila TaxID=2841697 RepID=A0A8J6N9W5_9BACT|nr:NifB/NifX family molybdenum-iron cluster-binding protein [Candidatus Desulfaltia bathyphila]
MKIAVTSTGPALDDTMEARFGRCAYFLIIDLDTMEFEAVENPNIALGGGAGIQSAQLMADKGVSTVLTGNCGPNAFQTFGAAKIQVITGVSGQVRQAVEQYKSGALASTTTPNVQNHFGMGMGGGRGMGGGGGRGMGGGGGMGMGGGSGMGRGMGASALAGSGQPEPTALSEEKRLKDQVNELRKQVETLQSSINALEKK